MILIPDFSFNSGITQFNVSQSSVWKDPDAGEDWGQEKKVATEDEMIGCDQGLDGHEFEQTPEDSEGQGSLVRCCSPWGRKESDTTEQLKNNHHH